MLKLFTILPTYKVCC